LRTESYLFTDSELANGAISVHMLAGAAITALAPLQVLQGPRRRWPWLHRATGRAIVAAALVAALGGLVFIAVRGTIGGAWMDFGFALYGAAMAVAAVQTFRHAKARDIARHRAWALRLVVLVLASWLFRVHYGIWFLATGGLWSNDSLTGPFDRVQVLAFFLPYLLILELWLRRGPRPDRPGAPRSR
jgi:hypothetical protein